MNHDLAIVWSRAGNMNWTTLSGDLLFLIQLCVSHSTFVHLTTSKARRLQTALPTGPPVIPTRLRPTECGNR